MSRFWLTYKQGRRFAGVVIVDAASLPSARKRASTKTGQKIQFASCTELFVELAKLVPPAAIGRMLSPNEAAKLISRLERGIPK
jgi:hypothetical protein